MNRALFRLGKCLVLLGRRMVDAGEWLINRVDTGAPLFCQKLGWHKKRDRDR